MPLRTYWWAATPNFGDRITEDVVAYVSGQEIKRENAANADIFAIGSIMLDVRRGIRRGNEGQPWIWGSGALRPMNTDFVDHIRVAAVRGPITRELLGLKTDVFGDPGVLMSLVLDEKIAKTGRIGVIPHFTKISETAERLAGLGDEVMIIDPAQENHLDVVRQIAGCEAVFSSSLHGLIVADAFGVPNVWLDPDGNHDCARLKFYDYAAGVGRVLPLPIPVEQIEHVLETGVAPISYADGVKQAQVRLVEAFPEEHKCKRAIYA
jgi:Polysaccharide pyruvyl transferase.